MSHQEGDVPPTVTLSVGGVAFCLEPSSCTDGNAVADSFAISKICSEEVVIDLNNFVGSIRIKNKIKYQERPVPLPNSRESPGGESTAAGATGKAASGMLGMRKKRAADGTRPSTAPLEKKTRATFDKFSEGVAPTPPPAATGRSQPQQVPQKHPTPPGYCADATAVDTNAASEAAPANNTGLWLQEEEERFLLGLRLFGWGKWKQIQAMVRTRTYGQTKTHAQKMEKANPEIRSIKCVRAQGGFEGHFNDLIEFRDTHGHCNVPQSNILLGTWVKNLRAAYRLRNEIRAGFVPKRDAHRRELTEDMIERLEGIGFQWTVKDNAWESKFEMLKEFKEENGHCLVPYHSTLGTWVSEQRKQYRKKVTKQKLTMAGTDESILAYMHHTMTDERMEKLNSIGFKWAIRVNNREMIEGFEGAPNATHAGE